MVQVFARFNTMGKNFINTQIALVFATTLILFGTIAKTEPTKLTFIHFNDLNRIESVDGRGGLAKLAAIVANERSRNDNVFVTFGGDFLEPSLMTAIYQGSPMIDLLNQLELTLMVVGDQDLNYGPAVLEERIEQAKFPIVSSNIIDDSEDPLSGSIQTWVMKVDDYRIGFIGLTSQTAMENATTGNFTVADPIAAAMAGVEKLRSSKVDLFVALAHTDNDVDKELMETGLFDIILGGYDEIQAIEWKNNTLFVESGAQAENVTMIDLYLDQSSSGESEQIDWYAETRMVNSIRFDPDPSIIERATYYEGLLDQLLSKELGITETELDSRAEIILNQEAAIGNLFTDALCMATGSDICIANGGGIRGNKIYPAGTTLTRKDLLSELPFVDVTMVLEVSGHVIFEALENGFSKLEYSLEEGAGRFLHISGLSVVVDPRAEPGNRIISVTRSGQPFDLDATYQLALNHFLANGGDEYEMFPAQKVIVDKVSGTLELEHISSYLLEVGRVSPKVEGRIVYLEH